jgi:histidyl-tRNA synthetase
VARKAALSARKSGEATFAWRIVQPQGALPSATLELHVIGHNSAMAEALLIVVGNAIVQNAGIETRTLNLNNLGSAESSGRYIRDVAQYLRKHIESISPTLRPRAAIDPLGTLVQLIDRGHPAVARAPQATEYLTEDERRRFWEFLEYLEVFGLPYELSGHVLGSRDVWSHSLYEIATIDPETQSRLPLAFGGRYDPLMSRFSRRSDSAAMIGIAIEVRGGIRPKKGSRTQPGIFFAHLGMEARRKALGVIETLRRSEIPIHQSLTYDRLGDQMATARQLGVPFILIMGHKEAVENAILVREVATNSQETVPLPELSNYLKRRRMGPRVEAHA